MGTLANNTNYFVIPVCPFTAHISGNLLINGRRGIFINVVADLYYRQDLLFCYLSAWNYAGYN